ncbi:hypothetical protein [Spirosoma arboris]|uniref:hypothetical protein n=1 Tax=Spirosoma arboris TaxID=2682092 RepID=UPI001D11CCCD|nr:hypothetical protein [Spirosoma arboris]
MYKIQFLLLLTLLSPLVVFGQQTSKRHLTNEVQTSRQTAFTAHLLTDQVEPEKKYTYELSIEGQKVSLSYPTQFQTQRLWQWQTDPPTFRFGVENCTYANELEVDLPANPIII